MARIYFLDDPTGESSKMYVGKTVKPLEVRLTEHIRGIKKKSIKNSWVKSLLSRGVNPRISLLEEVSDDLWQEAERRWIRKFRDDGKELVNGTTGGDGLHQPTFEVREKIRQAHLGKHLSQEHRENVGKSLLGKKRKQQFTAEVCEKLSEALTGRALTREHRDNISKGITGELNPFYGKTHSVESREKNRQAHLGRRLSDEAKEKCRAAALKRWRKS